jgi:cytochrome c oxidase assembly protein subunit 15
MTTTALYNFNPVLWLAGVGLLLGGGLLAWNGWRHRHASPAVRLRALTLLTLFLTFDLVVFGAFTRLTDSGLGCPDWPGCYGSATPLGAHADIQAAQTAMPTGPVTHGKAWVEMVHRYLATGVGVLIIGLAVGSWRLHRRGDAAVSPWWATTTLVWVCLQGAFGAWTVTMKLYPAIVTLHLLGGMGLLVLLAVQSQGYVRNPLPLSRRLHAGMWLLAVLSLIQITLGGWVSTNYAVLACTDFPTCQGEWWPAMDFEHGFTVLRELGAGKSGGFLPFAALTAIHVTHRVGALVVFGVMLLVAWGLHAVGQTSHRRWAGALVGLALWQFASGLSNVVLGWPLVAALAHTAGAAALITLLAVVLARARQARAAS